jgi:hypothetical protein
MNCQYCTSAAKPLEGSEIAVCPKCWQLLQNPATALPLIRGHLTMTLRGTMPDSELKTKIDAFMVMIAAWDKKEPSN